MADDLLDDEDDVDVLVTVETHPAERIANERAKQLVEAGIGAVVEPATVDAEPASGLEPDPDPGPVAPIDVATDAGTAPPLDADADLHVTLDGPPLLDDDDDHDVQASEPAQAAEATEAAGDGGPPGFDVRVVPEQLERAYEVLGLAVPDDLREEPVQRDGPPWKTILIIWAIAMVVVPLLAGYLTFLFLSNQ